MNLRIHKEQVGKLGMRQRQAIYSLEYLRAHQCPVDISHLYSAKLWCGVS